ncbi:MAG: SPASM domain-containing protein [Candidatus Omnitrophota bacterium]
MIKKKRAVKLEAVNLSLCSLCNADCMYCPSDRGGEIKEKIMPFSIVKKIIGEISSEKFKKYHDVKIMSVSQNGEALLHPEIINILHFIKIKLPHIKINFFSNLGVLTEKKSETIVKEHLIDNLFCSVDASNSQNCFYINDLDFKKIKHNLRVFITFRNKVKQFIPITLYIITLYSYIHTIYNNFGFYPFKMQDKNLINVKNDYLIIKERYKKMLSRNDRIVKPAISAWAERARINTNNLNYSKYNCPVLNRIKKEAFIAPNGDWYACCLDAKNKLLLGNITKKTINKIFFSKRRAQLIELLENKQFHKIGGPCKTVNCCGWFTQVE